MPGLRLREAAQQAGTSKSTILRAIQTGRLSAARTDDGGYSIDPAELFRVYPPKSSTDAPVRPTDHSTGQGETPSAPPATPDATELRNLNVQLLAVGVILMGIIYLITQNWWVAVSPMPWALYGLWKAHKETNRRMGSRAEIDNELEEL